jgi:hypothetical protein
MTKWRIRILFILTILFLVSSNLFGAFSDMIVYEFRLLDISQEETERLEIKDLSLANEIDTPESIIFYPFNGSAGAFELTVEGLSDYINVNTENLEKSFAKKFNPVIITTMNSPSSVSAYSEEFGLIDGDYSVEFVNFYVIPEQFSEKGGFLTTVNINSSGNSSVGLSVSARHKEDEWIPLAIVSLKNPQKSGSLLFWKESNLVRHSILFVKANRYSKEALTGDVNIFANLTGMESLLGDEVIDAPTLHHSFFRTEIGFDNSGIERIILDYRQILLKSFYSELTFSMNPNAMEDLKIGLELGIFGETDFALKVFGNYLINDASNKSLTVDFGIEDFTQPVDFMILGASLYLFRLYPLAPLEEIYEFPMIWSFESKFLPGKNYFITLGLEGKPVPEKVYLNLGYEIVNFSIVLAAFYKF